MNKGLLILIVSSFLSSCKKDEPEVNFTESKVSLSAHTLTTYSIIKNSTYIIVFESGLGDDHSIWNQKNIPLQINSSEDVLTYDRAGYGKSTIDNSERTISTLESELESVVNAYANGRKVILVSHSLGGMIIRDYAVKNPEKIAALLFVEPSHENYNQPTQEIEDMIYNSFKESNGVNFGGTREARQLIEDSDYMETLTDLPNVPVIVLTSMKTDATHTVEDRAKWYAAHELLKTGITDFTHITTTKSGHYILTEEPKLVLDNLHLLTSKLAP